VSVGLPNMKISQATAGLLGLEDSHYHIFDLGPDFQKIIRFIT